MCDGAWLLLVFHALHQLITWKRKFVVMLAIGWTWKYLPIHFFFKIQGEYFDIVQSFNLILYLYRNITPEEKYGQLFVLSLKLALWMQIIGFSVRFLSSFIWIQMYRLGVSSSTPTYHEVNYDGRNSFLSPRSSSVRRNSMADDILGGSIYDPAYYSSLFEDVRNNTCTHQVFPPNFFLKYFPVCRCLNMHYSAFLLDIFYLSVFDIQLRIIISWENFYHV